MNSLLKSSSIHRSNFAIWVALAAWLAFLPVDIASAQNFERLSFRATDGQDLLYCFSKPANQDKEKKCPLVLLLHGRGARGNDNNKPLDEFRQFTNNPALAQFPCFIVVPQCPANDMWCDFKVNKKPLIGYENIYKPKPTPIEARVIQLLDSLGREYSIDLDRVYVTGLSMGGYGTWDLIVREPRRFAAAAPICGDGDQSKVNIIKHIPIWIAHGTNDPIVDVKYSRQMNTALKKVNGAVEYKEVPGGAHNVWGQTYGSSEFIHWLFGQQKKVEAEGAKKPTKRGK